jgi:hypothetical protein
VEDEGFDVWERKGMKCTGVGVTHRPEDEEATETVSAPNERFDGLSFGYLEFGVVPRQRTEDFWDTLKINVVICTMRGITASRDISNIPEVLFILCCLLERMNPH